MISNIQPLKKSFNPITHLPHPQHHQNTLANYDKTYYP